MVSFLVERMMAFVTFIVGIIALVTFIMLILTVVIFTSDNYSCDIFVWMIDVVIYIII